MGTLADFLEVSGEHESVVDEFLREELNYIVVESWIAAEQGVRLLKSGGDGRATFLVHPHPEGGNRVRRQSLDRWARPHAVEGDNSRAQRFRERSLETMLPKLRYGYLVEKPATHSDLPSEHGHAFFLTRRASAFTTQRSPEASLQVKVPWR